MISTALFCKSNFFSAILSYMILMKSDCCIQGRTFKSLCFVGLDIEVIRSLTVILELLMSMRQILFLSVLPWMLA